MEKTETMKHTKEPWIADLRSGCCAIYPENRTEESEGCHRDDNRNVRFSSKGSRYIESPKGGRWDMDEQTRVDFKRIVACVNACADVEDKKLKLGYVKELEEENAELKAQLTWRPVGEKPEKDQIVIATYLNQCGKRRRVTAVYIRQYEEEAGEDDELCVEYCEERDEYYLKEGWYSHHLKLKDLNPLKIALKPFV